MTLAFSMSPRSGFGVLRSTARCRLEVHFTRGIKDPVDTIRASKQSNLIILKD